MKIRVVAKNINGKRYSTLTAKLLADEGDWPGFGRKLLYMTPRKKYFSVQLTQNRGETDQITPLDYSDALDLWKQLPMKVVDFKKAFPHS